MQAPLYFVQNVDKIARSTDYKMLKDNELLVHGVFATIQGEGPFVGTPCVFLRLAGCNFGDKKGFCEFCDTEFKLANGKPLQFHMIRNKIVSLSSMIGPGKVRKLLVVSGGEPGLQPNTPRFLDLMVREGWTVQVETNGTQHRFASELRDAKSWVDTILVISPKAGPNGYPNLSFATWMWGQNCLKILIDHREDSKYHTVPNYAREWAALGYRVYLSPLAIYKKEYSGEISSLWDDTLIDKHLTSANYNYAAHLAMEEGFLLSTQQHLTTAIA